MFHHLGIEWKERRKQDDKGITNIVSSSHEKMVLQPSSSETEVVLLPPTSLTDSIKLYKEYNDTKKIITENRLNLRNEPLNYVRTSKYT